VKQQMGFRRWTVRGLEKARVQWALLCTTWNLQVIYRRWRDGPPGPRAPAPRPPAPRRRGPAPLRPASVSAAAKIFLSSPRRCLP
jgi:hypothetical protein